MMPEVLQQRALAGDEAALATWRQVAASLSTGVPLDEIEADEEE